MHISLTLKQLIALKQIVLEYCGKDRTDDESALDVIDEILVIFQDAIDMAKVLQ